MKAPSLRKLKHILCKTYHLFQRKKKKLSSQEQTKVQEALIAMQNEILAGNRKQAASKGEQLQALAKVHLRKSSFEQTRDFIIGIAVALCIAIVVRQVWFEFYEIPTGSMRPTLKEQDRLAVSKTDFGINLPLKPKHFYFDPHLVQRSGIFIFTGENMDIRDVDTMYFYIFPGKKQYVKRLMGKPGDTLYFYGGMLYGIDAEGRDISQELQLDSLDKIDHVPFIHFEGKVKSSRKMDGVQTPITIYQMNEPVARLTYAPSGRVEGKLEPAFQQAETYSDLWGIKNYAMVRLINAKEVPAALRSSSSQAVLYLELKHHPSLQNAKVGFDEYGRFRPILSLQTSYMPLTEVHLRSLMNNLYTARFEVKNGIAMRYGSSPQYARPFAPKLSGVPDGMYEFYYGKAYRILWQGIEVELPPDHPLYTFDKDRIQTLFNLGMEFDTRYSVESKHASLMPARFAYFRNGDFFVMGAPILKKEDPTLISFIKQESNKPVPFADMGAPLHPDGSLDVAFIQKYGITVPPKSYLALGDNYAMSADSRDFGFVPESNLRGGPDFIFWPPGKRWGAPNQPPYPFFNGPRTIIWMLATIACTGWYLYHRRRNRLPLSFD